MPSSLCVAAEALHQRGQAIGVRGDDLPRPGPGARLDQLIARRQDGDARRAANLQARMAGGGGKGNGRSVEQAAGAQQRVALTEVAARPADVGAGACGLAHAQRIAFTLCVFLDDHAVGALGDGGTGEDAHRFAGADCRRRTARRRWIRR